MRARTMRPTLEECSVYSLNTYNCEGIRLGTRVFRGVTAFTQANDHLDALRQMAPIHEIWLTRLDGDEWQFVEQLWRDDAGHWHSIREYLGTAKSIRGET